VLFEEVINYVAENPRDPSGSGDCFHRRVIARHGRAIDEGVFVRMIKGPTPDGSSRDEPTLASIGPGDDRFCLFDD
jgi:hypothetical protein